MIYSITSLRSHCGDAVGLLEGLLEGCRVCGESVGCWVCGEPVGVEEEGLCEGVEDGC